MAIPIPTVPHGRTLRDFGELSPAEDKLVWSCRMGALADIAGELPEEQTEANGVRSGLIRFLLLGGDESAPVHEQSLRLRGAWLIDPLELWGTTIEHMLILMSCRIEYVDVRYAHLKLLSLNGCRLTDGLFGDGLRCPSGVFLGDGFHATGGVRLICAKIGISLECNGGRFDNEGDVALNCFGADISGYIALAEGFEANGEVRLAGASIGGHVNCRGGLFRNSGGNALSCDALISPMSILLGDGFHASGAVSVDRARIGGTLSCEGGTFDCPGGTALSCEGAEIGNAITLRWVERIDGGILLTATRVANLCDDEASWRGAHGWLVLDGFTYARLAGSAPIDAAMRIAWLDRQYPPDLREDFRPQPWEQLAAVLRAMGHPDQARAVAVAKQVRMRRAGRLPGGARPFHWLYGLLVGYGYRPMRLLAATAAIWMLCALAYWWAANPGGLGPSTHLIAPSNREASAPAPDYRNFVPLIYSADVLLPVVDLGYRDAWQPVVADVRGEPLFWGQALRFLYWFEIAFGWVAGLLIVGVLGTLIKKD